MGRIRVAIYFCISTLAFHAYSRLGKGKSPLLDELEIGEKEFRILPMIKEDYLFCPIVVFAFKDDNSNISYKMI